MQGMHMHRRNHQYYFAWKFWKMYIFYVDLYSSIEAGDTE